MNVMFVSDQDYHVDLIQSMLKQVGARRVSQFYNPLAGIDALKRDNYQLIIFWWDMEKITGQEFLLLLSDLKSNLKINLRKIAMSFNATRAKVKAAKQYGADDFLVVPFSLKSLSSSIYKSKGSVAAV